MSGKNSIRKLQEKAAKRDVNPHTLADTLDVCIQTLENWIEGRTQPSGYNKQKIDAWVKGELEMDTKENRGCRIRDCRFPPQYEYENPHSGTHGKYCESHMNTRRSDMDVSDWLDLGYATVIQ